MGVAATKTHLSQIVALDLIALALAQARGTLSAHEGSQVLDELLALPDRLDEVLLRGPDVAKVAEAVVGGAASSSSGDMWGTRWRWKVP